MPESASDKQQLMRQQSGKLLAHAAGFVGVKTIEIGLERGLFAELAEHPAGIDASSLAKQTSLDPFYVAVWCRSAYAAELLDASEEGSYSLAPAIAALLLDRDSPAYMGPMFTVLPQPEFFDTFAERLRSGARTWWNQFRPEFIHRAAATGRSFYTRLIPAAFERIPELNEQLLAGARVVELACGGGSGLARMARMYPSCELLGVDGDAYSLELAARTLEQENLDGRTELRESTLEEFSVDGEFDMAFSNIALHEARDINQVADNVYQALKPGGFFVVSDFPFPNSEEALRAVPGRFMAGIQFFEAQIDAQLLSTGAYIDLLSRHGFRDVNAFDLTPMHAVTHARR